MFTRKCKITFIRHGATLYTEENRLFDEENYPPINESGREEMDKISSWIKNKGLKADKIYCSSSLRTIQSTRILSKKIKQDFEILNTLKSRRAGLWSGLTFNQIEEKFPHMLNEYHKNPETFWAPDGENTQSLNLRVKEDLDKIIENNTGNRLIIITHGEIIQAAIANAIEILPKNQFKIHVPTGSATQISYYSDWASLVYSGYLPL